MITTRSANLWVISTVAVPTLFHVFVSSVVVDMIHVLSNMVPLATPIPMVHVIMIIPLPHNTRLPSAAICPLLQMTFDHDSIHAGLLDT